MREGREGGSERASLKVLRLPPNPASASPTCCNHHENSPWAEADCSAPTSLKYCARARKRKDSGRGQRPKRVENPCVRSYRDLAPTKKRAAICHRDCLQAKGLSDRQGAQDGKPHLPKPKALLWDGFKLPFKRGTEKMARKQIGSCASSLHDRRRQVQSKWLQANSPVTMRIRGLGNPGLEESNLGCPVLRP